MPIVAQETAQELRHSHTTVGTTRVPLTTLEFPAYKGVLVRTPGTDDPTPNTGVVWVGGPAVTADSSSTGGIPVPPGSSIFIPIDKASKLHVISDAVDQDIAWLLL